MDVSARSALLHQIEQQKIVYRSLQSDSENPRILDQQIETLEQVVKELPQRLDTEIEQARQTLANLIESRDNKIASKTQKLTELVTRRANLKDQLIDSWDLLQSLNQELKKQDATPAIEKYRQLQAQLAAMESEIPEHLRIATKDELQTQIAAYERDAREAG